MENSVDLAVKTVEYATSIGASYCDVRLEEAKTTSLRVSKGSLEASGSSSVTGLGIRVLVDGSWGFVSTEVLEWDRIKEAVLKAYKLAKSSSERKLKKVKIAEAKPVKTRVKGNIKKDPLNIPIEEKVKLVMDVDKVLREYSLVKDDRVRYGDVSYRKIIATSEGSEIIIEGSRIRMVIYTVAKKNGILSPAYDLIAKSMGFEIFKKYDPFKRAKKVAERSSRLVDAPVPKGGLKTVVLDNDLIGMIVHEAFGHTAEADHVIAGTVLSGKIGEKVGAETVTIVDSPGPSYSYGWTPYDDEGVEGRDVVIVEKGILREYMQNRETAAETGMNLTGNGRAENYGYAPLVRMRTTYMDKGDWSPEEIIEDTRDGFYLVKSLHGQSDMNGVFMFVVQEAWEIKNGELVRPYRGVTLSGNSIEALLNIDAVGKDLVLDSPGMCGKLQWVPVDGGGPHVRTRLMVGGER